jgi:hypothetical protein
MGLGKLILLRFPKIISCMWPCTHMKNEKMLAGSTWSENEAVDMFYSRAVSLLDMQCLFLDEC